jgi:HNH endonuclease
MSKTSNIVKASQLGMPLGTATSRLRKMLLFKFAKKLGEDVCFKCKLKIEDINEFSIEHKQPWLHVSKELFWDLDNIAFSHLKCNLPDRWYHKSPHFKASCPRIERPAGMNWCNRHKKFLPVEQFSKNSWHWSGYHTLCKECQHYTRP